MIKLLILFLCVIVLVSCNKYTNNEGCTKDESGNEQCLKKDEYDDEDEDDEPVFYEIEEKMKTREPLFQWDPVKVGHVREVKMEDGSIKKMVTMALKPKIFVIDNFLTDEECDHIIEKAKYFGLMNSGLHIDEKVKMSKIESYGKAKSSLGDYKYWDLNMDGEITRNEVIDLARRNLKLYINVTDVKTMFVELGLHELDDGVITREEFASMNTAGITEYLKQLRETHPRFRDRFSEQIWLKQGNKSDVIMQKLRRKVTSLTNLPAYIVEGGEPLQVLNYQPFGHYHAHFDGQSDTEYPNYPCCHMDAESQPTNCRLCRFVTIVYYLNNVEKGGETAFPVADKKDYDHDEFRKRKVEDYYNLSKFCHNASVVVKPKKGRAVMWYNHHMDKDGWLGAMDYYSLHGGCDIIKGTKWLANNWLTAPPAKYAYMDSLYYKGEAEGAY